MRPARFNYARLLWAQAILFCLISGPTSAAPEKSESKAASKKTESKTEASRSVLSFREFLAKTLKNDPRFELILMEQLYLKYGKDLGLPPSDLLLEVNGQYGYYVLDEDRHREVDRRHGLALSKLFPTTGTRLALEYAKNSVFRGGSVEQATSLGFEIGQAVGRNAFGRITRKTERRIELQTDLARHQLVEAYEDYLASLLVIYLGWHRAEERRAAAESAVREATLVYDLTLRKARFGIAYRHETQRSRLDVIIANQNLVAARAEERSTRRRVSALSGLKDEDLPGTELPNIAARNSDSGQAPPAERTRKMMKLLQDQGLVVEEIAEANLLPSAEIFAGYQLLGDRYDLARPDRRVYFGATVQINFGRKQDKARHETAKLDSRRLRLQARRLVISLDETLATVRDQLAAALELQKLGRERLTTAQSVLAAEHYNYRLGKSQFADLSLARTQVESARVNSVEQEATVAQLRVELLRLEDRLVQRLPPAAKEGRMEKPAGGLVVSD